MPLATEAEGGEADEAGGEVAVGVVVVFTLMFGGFLRFLGRGACASNASMKPELSNTSTAAKAIGRRS